MQPGTRSARLRVQLELAEELFERDPAQGQRKLHALGDEVAATLEEIRSLAGGVYPSLLADRGDAHAVTIVLGQDDALRFEVRDDGAGFDEMAVRPGAGLTNMRDRLAAVGGAVEIRSAPGCGTVVSGSVPLEGASVPARPT